MPAQSRYQSYLSDQSRFFDELITETGTHTNLTRGTRRDALRFQNYSSWCSPRPWSTSDAALASMIVKWRTIHLSIASMRLIHQPRV